MKYADKIGAKFVIVLGDNELEQKAVKVKNMTTGEQTELALDDSFGDKFSDLLMASIFDKLDREEEQK